MNNHRHILSTLSATALATLHGTERWYDCSYDINNRPRSVRFSSGARTDYLYDATGTKLRTVHTIPSVPPSVPMEGDNAEESIVSTTDYSGGYIYENGTVDRLLTTNGFVTFAADGTPAYHYYLKDYLGNVRAVISHDGSVEQTAHYYPFGSLMATTEYQPKVTHPNRHLYGGKELDRTSGLDLLDFEARAYDPLLPRFRSMDPLCHKYYDISPYAYCANNPFRNTDPTGMDFSILIAPDGASGFGHIGAVIQDKAGKYYYISAGATERVGMSTAISNCNVKGGMIILDLHDAANSMTTAIEISKTVDTTNSTYTDAVTFVTTSEIDGIIFDNAIEKQQNLESGEEKYRTLTNNCADIVEDIIEKGTGINLSTGLSPSPNHNFKEITDKKEKIQSDINNKKSDVYFID